jgi:hypothetical protein
VFGMHEEDVGNCEEMLNSLELHCVHDRVIGAARGNNTCNKPNRVI